MAQGRGKGRVFFCFYTIFRPYLSWVLFQAILGGSALIAGYFLLTYADRDQTRNLLRVYFEAVEAWNTEHYNTFSKFRFYLEGNNKTWHQLEKVIDLSDDLAPIPHVIWPWYPRLAFYSPVPWAQSKVWDPPLNGCLRIKILSVGSDEQIFGFHVVDLAKQTSFNSSELACIDLESCEEACSNLKGFWDKDKDTCFIFEIADQFCLKIYENNTYWHADPAYGGFGCGTCNSHWSVLNYEYLKKPIVGKLELPKTTLLRSSRDPYIIASSLTGGSMNFSSLIVQPRLFFFGWSCIAGGAFLIILVVIPIRLCYRIRSKKRIYRMDLSNPPPNYVFPPTSFPPSQNVENDDETKRHRHQY